MEPIDDQLHRLLKAAAAAPREELPDRAPLGFSARVLASVRSSRRSDDNAGSVRVMRWAIAFACLVMIFALAYNMGAIHSFLQTRTAESDELNVADSAIQLALAQ